MRSRESDQHILNLGARYIRRLWELERSYFLGDPGSIEILLGDLDPVDLKNVADALDQMRSRLAFGTEPRVAADGNPSQGGCSEPALLRSSVPASFFPESLDAWRA